MRRDKSRVVDYPMYIVICYSICRPLRVGAGKNWLPLFLISLQRRHDEMTKGSSSSGL